MNLQVDEITLNYKLCYFFFYGKGNLSTKSKIEEKGRRSVEFIIRNIPLFRFFIDTLRSKIYHGHTHLLYKKYFVPFEFALNFFLK